MQEQRAEVRLGDGFLEAVERDRHARLLLGQARSFYARLARDPSAVVERPVHLDLRASLFARGGRRGSVRERNRYRGHIALQGRLAGERKLRQPPGPEASQPEPGCASQDLRLECTRVLVHRRSPEHSEIYRIL